MPPPHPLLSLTMKGCRHGGSSISFKSIISTMPSKDFIRWSINATTIDKNTFNIMSSKIKEIKIVKGWLVS